MQECPSPQNTAIAVRRYRRQTRGQQTTLSPALLINQRGRVFVVEGGLLTSLSKPSPPAKFSPYYECISGTPEARAPSPPRPGTNSPFPSLRPAGPRGAAGGPQRRKRLSGSRGGQRPRQARRAAPPGPARPGRGDGPVRGASGVSASRHPGAVPPEEGRGV